MGREGPREGRQAEAELAAWPDRQGHLEYFASSARLLRVAAEPRQECRQLSRCYRLVRLGSIRRDGGCYRGCSVELCRGARALPPVLCLSQAAQSHVIDSGIISSGAAVRPEQK